MSGQSANSGFEVVASTRRRWLPEERQAILSEASGGVSVSEVARRHGLSRELLFRWRRELRKKAVTAGQDGGEHFMRLSLPPPGTSADGAIEIVLPSGCRVIVDARCNVDALKRIIEALR
jgi:transposase